MTRLQCIHKYPLPFTSLNTAVVLDLPIEAKLLDAQLQNGVVVLWVLVDPNADAEKREFVLYATGATIDVDTDRYIATIQLPRGLVGRLFEEIKA